MKLSSNEELTIPIVIKTVILAQIISQYVELCSEEGFKPMGRSTLYRVLRVYLTSVRKSLQGLDYAAAQGAKAFEELEFAAEKIGVNFELGLSWAKGKKRAAKSSEALPQGRFQENSFAIVVLRCKVKIRDLTYAVLYLTKPGLSRKEFEQLIFI